MMRVRRLLVSGALLLALAVSVGCGRGLSVNLTASPSPAVPGAPYDLLVQLTNDTQCATADDVSLPNGPSNIPPLVFVVAFDPTLASGEPAAFCRALQTCSDLDCILALSGGAFGEGRVAQLRAGATELASRKSSAARLSGAEISECIEFENDDEFGVLGVCAFDPIGPGGSRSVTLSGITPDTGNRMGAQLAIAIAGARGPDCSPGAEGDPGEWQLGGCFPLLVERSLVPAVSSSGLAILIAALLAAAAFGLRRLAQR